MKLKIKRKPIVIQDPTNEHLITQDKSGVWDIHRDGVTQGLLANFMLCPEKCRLSSVEGLSQIRTGGALAFGSLIHDVLDEVYSHVMRKKGASDWYTFAYSVLTIALRDKEKKDRQAINEKGGSNPEALVMLEENYGIAEGILPGYLKRWESDFVDVEWVALEQMFETPVTFKMEDGEEVTLKIRGKRYGVFRSRKSNKLYLFETKTKGRIDEDSIMDRLVFDLQVMLYLWSMWKDYGEVPQGVVYNIMRKPQLKRKKEESLKQFIDRVWLDTETRPDFYYMRYNSDIVLSDLKSWEEEFITVLRQLVRWTRGKFHWKNSNACSMGGVNCQFLPVCSRGDRSSFKLKEVPFPELVEGDTE